MVLLKSFWASRTLYYTNLIFYGFSLLFSWSIKLPWEPISPMTSSLWEPLGCVLRWSRSYAMVSQLFIKLPWDFISHIIPYELKSQGAFTKPFWASYSLKNFLPKTFRPCSVCIERFSPSTILIVLNNVSEGFIGLKNLLIISNNNENFIGLKKNYPRLFRFIRSSTNVLEEFRNACSNLSREWNSLEF